VGRPVRQFYAGGIYHVFSRGSDRRRIFSFESDHLEFLMCLERVITRRNLRCFAYCLMPNHYHLVLETGDGELSRAMQTLNGRYSLRFNKRYGRTSHLFKNRFGAVHQETTPQLLWTLRYVVVNPVESGLCEAAAEWVWSSYRASAGFERPPSFLDVERLLSYFGDGPQRARTAYRAFVGD
jgi:putative transposase